jgi:hypothetical protein
MTDTVRVWLVERSYDHRDLITTVYATPAGDRALRLERAATVVDRGSGITAARDVAPDALDPVDGDLRDRYAAEAARMADRHDPDERV